MSRMMNKLITIRQLKDFGLDTKGANIYLSLLSRGPQTSLELSRQTGYNRTSIYRYLEELKKIGVVEEIVDENRKLAAAFSPGQLKLLVSKKEAEVDQLKSTLPPLIEELSRFEHNSPSPTEILYFRGKSGMEQMIWNLLKIPRNGEFTGQSYLPWNDLVGQKFADKVRQELMLNNIKSRELTNNPGPFDYVYEELYDTHLWVERYISPKILDIKFESFIYNDVYAFFHYHKGEIFGVEIHNQENTNYQNQLFGIVWKMAEPVKKPISKS